MHHCDGAMSLLLWTWKWHRDVDVTSCHWSDSHFLSIFPHTALPTNLWWELWGHISIVGDIPLAALANCQSWLSFTSLEQVVGRYQKISPFFFFLTKNIHFGGGHLHYRRVLQTFCDWPQYPTAVILCLSRASVAAILWWCPLLISGRRLSQRFLKG